MDEDVNSSKNRLPWIKRLVYLFVFLVVLAALAEFGMRVAKVAMRPKPTTTGAAGPCQSLVVLCIGDSFTYGLGAKKGEAYPDQLDDFFARVYPGAPVKVHNIGIPGTNTTEQIERMKNFFKSYKFERVDFAFILSGVNNRWNLHDASFWKWEKDARKKYTSQFFQSKFQLSKFFSLAGQNGQNLVKSAENTHGKTYREMLDQHGWNMFFKSFDDDLLARWITYDYGYMSKYLRARKIEPIFLTYHYARFPNINKRVRESVSEIGEHLIDLEKPVQFYRRRNLLAKDGFHMNGKGYKAFAGRIVKGLSEIFDKESINEVLKKKKEACIEARRKASS